MKMENIRFERGTKTRTAGCIERAFQPKMFASGGDHCPVMFYKAYLRHRPDASNTSESPFYLGIKHKRDADSIIWYINYPMGKNKLGTFMSTASKAIGISDKKVTNHSVRKTMIQRLLNSKFTPNEVAQLSGHMTASEKTQKEMLLLNADSFSSSSPIQIPSLANSSSQSTPTSANMIPGISGLFTNDVMTGCTPASHKQNGVQ